MLGTLFHEFELGGSDYRVILKFNSTGAAVKPATSMHRRCHS